MSSLREIKRRIKSVQNIQQIAGAMEMVSASLLRRAQKNAKAAYPYKIKMEELMRKLPFKDFKHPLLAEREIKKTALVVVSGDRGLCGSYHSHLFEKASLFLKEHEQVELFAIGKKGIDFFRGKGFSIKKQMEKMSFGEIKSFTEELMIAPFDAVYVLYVHHINAIQREVVLEKFIPIEVVSQEDANHTLEPGAEEIIADWIPRYLVMKLHHILSDAYIAEQAARVFSMRSAAKNAAEMIESLTLTRNKVRQENITKEMLEITAGAEGLK